MDPLGCADSFAYETSPISVIYTIDILCEVSINVVCDNAGANVFPIFPIPINLSFNLKITECSSTAGTLGDFSSIP